LKSGPQGVEGSNLQKGDRSSLPIGVGKQVQEVVAPLQWVLENERRL